MIKQANIKVEGVAPLLLNNPQTVDPFNKYAKMKSKLTSKKTKTDDDRLEIHNIEMASKLYWDAEKGVSVPTGWLSAAIPATAYGTVKISKAKMRGGLFFDGSLIKLNYEGMSKVKTIDDIIGDDNYRKMLILPQQNVRLAKVFPIFNKWSFETTFEFDDSVIDFETLQRLVVSVCQYGGFGDFRPTYGRAKGTLTEV